MKNTLKNCFTGFVAIAALLALIVACHKDPTPSPTPEPEPTPSPDTTQIIDTTTIIEPPIDTVTYPDTVWLDMEALLDLPPMDSIEFYADKNSVKKIIMNLKPYNSCGWTPHLYMRARDSLQKRIDVAPSKVWGAGTIYVAPFNGAQMPDPNDTQHSGMAAVDSAWYVEHGWEIKRDAPPYDKQH